MKSNTEQLKIAERYMGESCPKCCHMRNNCCCYFVSMGFRNAGNASLFYGGQIVTYCPNAIKWCKTHLAQIPLYLAMPSDIIFFDWNLNGDPNHIGFVDHRIDDIEIATLEANTTGKYVVANRVRTAKYIQGIFRPEFKATYKIGKLEIDGQFDYSSIAMLQKALGIKVDGILGKQTVKALQKKVGATQDGSWGVGTSKAVQKFLKAEGFYTGKIDGHVYEGTVKALQKWINSKTVKTTTTTNKTPVKKPQSSVKPSAPKPTNKDDGKLTVNGVIDKITIKRMQEFFGTEQDGIISGQEKKLYKYYESFKKSAVEFDGKGSACIKKLQKWLGVYQDGIIGEDTVKAWQKKLKVTVDGSFGTKSAKAWQKYLNEHDKPSYPKPTWADKANQWAIEIAKKGYHYVVYNSGAKAHECPICHDHPKGKFHGWNCIGFLMAILHHGGGLKNKCGCGVIDNSTWEKLLKVSQKEADRIVSEKMGIPMHVIRNDGKAIPVSKLKKGDGLCLYNGNKALHVIYYMGNGHYADCGRGHTPQIQAGAELTPGMKKKIKLAIRYEGK